ncbi:MAG: hypothetical protein EU530_04280 [Promethearchaeota archaeon]|nr:MAG: hypothetical protein EU530_04280 [Candidatus Lokiarchaeota archaeon]
MSIITLNSNSTLHDLISFYENSIDFIHFYRGILDFYLKNRERFLRNQIMEPLEFHRIVTSLTDFLSNTHPSNQEGNRKFGRYFTPKSICRFINQRVLYQQGKIDFSEGKVPIILDPSAGLGYFLVDMLFLLIKIELKEKTSLTSLQTILSSMFGCEIDDQTNTQGRTLFRSIIGLIFLIRNCTTDFIICSKIISQNFIHQDFLKAEIPFTPQIVIGNPPYVRVHKLESTYNSYLRSHFLSAKYDFDIYVCFFEKCIKLLPKGGLLGFITPEKYLLRKYGGKLRLLMLIHCVPLEFIDISRCSDLFEVFTYPLITILRKIAFAFETKVPDLLEHLNRLSRDNPNDTLIFIRTSQFSYLDQNWIHRLLDFPNDPSDSIPNTIEWKVFTNQNYNKFLSNEGYRFNFILNPVVDELEAHFHDFSRFRDTDLLLFSGTPRSKYYHQVIKNVFEDKKEHNNALKFIMSKNVAPYCIFWELPVGLDGQEYLFPQYKLKNSVFSPSLISNFQSAPKLILKANSRNLTAAIDRVGYSFMGGYGLIWGSKFLNLEVICAIINSDLVNYYITKKFQSYMVNSHFLSINSIMVKDIPLPGRIDSTTGKFEPLIAQKEFDEIIDRITRIVANLEKEFQIVKSTENKEEQIKLKQLLYESQLNTKINTQTGKKGVNLLIQSQIKKLNELVFELYNIPKSIVQ